MGDPLTIAAIVSAAASGIGAIGSLTGAGANKPVEYKPVSPQQEEYQKFLMDMLKQKMNQPRPFAQMPSIYGNAMQMIYPYYFGQDWQAPQTGWMGPNGYMGGGNMYGPSNMPTQNMGMPQINRGPQREMRRDQMR